MAEFRTRNYATVVYPESAPPNWLELLSDHHIPCFVSPLHCDDINPGGEVKKPHFHVMIMFDNVKTRKQAVDVFSSFGGVGCEIVNSLRGYARYLCHLDNPEKAQYCPDEVICYGGADYFECISLISDRYGALSEMAQYIRDNKVVYYDLFFFFCMDNRPDWFRILCDNGTYVIKEVIKSQKLRSVDMPWKNPSANKLNKNDSGGNT